MTRSIHFMINETDGYFQIEAATGGAESFTLNIEPLAIPRATITESPPAPKPAPRRRPPAKKKPAARRRR